MIAARIMQEYAEYAALNPDEMPPLSKLWDELALVEQRDVLIALAAMSRRALAMAGARADMIDWPMAGELCALARRSLDAMLDGSRWEMPECRHCARTAARLICAVSWVSYRAVGFSPAQIAAAGWSGLAARRPRPVLRRDH